MTLPATEAGVPMQQLGHICSPPLPAVQIQLATAFWAKDPNNYAPTTLQPYADFCFKQCQRMCHSLRMTCPISDHATVIQLAQDVKGGLTRQEIVRKLESKRSRSPGANSVVDVAETVNGAIDLVSRLLLMCDVGRPAANRTASGRAFRIWNQGTISDFTANTFPVQRSNRHGGIQLDTNFNARNLDAIGGFRVELTNNLLDHLEVVDIEGRTTVMIFHHASFLKNQEYPFFPDGFVEETLQTLALLFPQNRWYKKTTSWYHKNLVSETTDADVAVFDCGPLSMTDIDAYHFWHDRLVRLKMLYDQAKPRTLRQWWNDRREGTQWYALWIAVGCTVFFGLVQSIEGAMQVYKSYHPS